ncbi:uncharacterized protein [Miscanthus floridulus]|uniref:uncharacterized protein n=1 Tax=Miscanthus floridulus TaxID=154761 RepID=UPI0034584A90
MPDFDQQFVVDCDASGPSRPFTTRHHKLAAYERKLIRLVQVVRHWRPYLWDRRFLVHTDHYSLKFLLDQRLSMVLQHQWISKLFEFDFAVKYRPRCLQSIADALSHRDADNAVKLAEAAAFVAALQALTSPPFKLLDDIRATTATDTEIFVPVLHDLRHLVIVLAHSAGHEGIQKTLFRLREDFYIPGDRVLVQDFDWACVTCQRNKTPTL